MANDEVLTNARGVAGANSHGNERTKKNLKSLRERVEQLQLKLETLDGSGLPEGVEDLRGLVADLTAVFLEIEESNSEVSAANDEAETFLAE